MSESALENLRKTFQENGDKGEQLFQQTVEAIRQSLEAGLRNIFWVGSIMMIVAFLIICTVPRKFTNSEE